MRNLSRSVAVVLAVCLGSEPGIAAAQTVAVRVQAAPLSGGAGSSGAALGASRFIGSDLRLPVAGLPGMGSLPVFQATPSVEIPAAALGPAAGNLATPVVPAVLTSALTGTPSPSASQTVAATAGELAPKLADVSAGIAGDAKTLVEAPSETASRAVSAQFNKLTGERWAEPADDVPASPEAGASQSGLEAPTHRVAETSTPETPVPPAVSAPAAGQAETKPAKKGWFQVFRDPERNTSFWRYVGGYTVYIFGIEMYVVGLPYLISSFTRNLLKENHDARLAGEEAVRDLVRENRSLARIAHWVAQAFSYASTPIFTRNPEQGPKKWLVRSFLIRSGIIMLIPTLFFASGLFTLPAALWTLFGLIAAQSFFQGLSVTMESASTARIMGDASVTDAERTRANSILIFLGALVAIIGPALAGQISLIQQLFGKTGVGGAVIYGIYGIAAGIAGLLYATISIIGHKAKAAKAEAAASGEAAPRKTPFSLKGLLRDLVTSLRDGIKLVFKDRFLRTTLIMTLVVSLFSDPLIFNVLPEFVENLITAQGGTVGALLKVPVLGWFLKGLVSTPMGYYGMLVAFLSAGSILATLLMEPMKRLFQKLGFKSEEGLSIPFYFMAALEVPLFWMLIKATSMWTVLGLYGMTALVTGFSGILVSGLYQKVLGKYSNSDITKILAAESLLGILAAILSTYVYGFVLTGIPIATALLFAAGATTVYGLLRLAAPWLYFTKAERQAKPKD